MTRTPAGLGPRARAVHGAARRLLHACLALLRATRRGRPAPPADDGPTRLTFVLHNAFGMGGTIRSTVTQANYFARHGVEVILVSVTRGGDRSTPFFAIDPRVRVEVLDEPARRRSPAARLLRRTLVRVPGLAFHPDETRIERMTAWRDLLLLRALWQVRDGTVVGTRAGINDTIARIVHPRVVRVGQEHVPLASYTPELLAELARSYRRLDALMVLTAPDHDEAAALLAGASTVLAVVPNALPGGPAPQADSSARRIVTAGRLSRNKRQDLLVRAFAAIADDHPDWELVIHGKGPRERRLRTLVEQLGVGERVRLPGATDRLPEALAEGSVFALTSQFEAFGIVLVEAMRAGMAVVSTDCRHGPAEIITDGVDGLLVTEGDLEAIADGLRRLVEDEQLRARLGATAAASARRYDDEVVAERWRWVYRQAAARRAITRR